MPFQKGHRLSVGNKGGGRKSSYEEHRAAAWHAQVWAGEQDIDALEAKIRSKKYAGRDMAALRLLKGDKTIVAKFMDKLVPDLHDVKMQSDVTMVDPHGVTDLEAMARNIGIGIKKEFELPEETHE